MSDNQPYSNEAYFGGGYKPQTTDSPFLTSSSFWLNDARAREFVAKHALRRNHRDVPPTYEITEALPLVKEFFIKHIFEVEELFMQERKTNKALDAFFEERFLSDITAETLKDYPRDSVGNLFHRYLVANKYVAEFDREAPISSTHIDYFMKRLSQQHDFEHILGGFSFDYIGEQGVTYMRHASYFQYLSPKLAGYVNTVYALLLTPQFTRTMLHYPETMNTLWDVILQAIKVGRTSEPMFVMKYEPILHLPVAEARKVMGYRNVIDMDVRAMANVWAEDAKIAVDPRRGEDLQMAAE